MVAKSEDKDLIDSQEDDFVFGELSTDKTESEAQDSEKDENEKEDSSFDETDDKSVESGDEKTEEESKPSKSEDVKSKDEKKKEEKEDDDIDIFLDESASSEDVKKISLKKLAKDLDVDLEKDDDEDEFKAKFSDRIEKAKQEFKLDGYSDGAKAIIKHLNENGGDIDSFFTNPKIISMQSVLALDPETKVRNVRIQEVMAEGKSRNEAVTIVDDEIKSWGTREIKDVASDIDSQAKKLINEEVKKIVGDQEIKATQSRLQKEAEVVKQRTDLKTFIDKQKDFLGLKLTPEAKKLILRDIDNGNFDKVISSNPEQIRFSSYMFSKYGSKIMKKIESTLGEQNRKGYNAATRKQLDALHKTEDEARQQKSGHSPQKRDQDTGSKPKWSSDDFE